MRDWGTIAIVLFIAAMLAGIGHGLLGPSPANGAHLAPALPLEAPSPPHEFDVEAFIRSRGWRLTRPELQTAIAAMIAAEAARQGAPIEPVLERAWRESRFTHEVNVNLDGSRDWGPLQVNDGYTPEVAGQPTPEAIRLGVSAWLKFYWRCRQDVACTSHAYRTGEVVR